MIIIDLPCVLARRPPRRTALRAAWPAARGHGDAHRLQRPDAGGRGRRPAHHAQLRPRLHGEGALTRLRLPPGPCSCPRMHTMPCADWDAMRFPSCPISTGLLRSTIHTPGPYPQRSTLDGLVELASYYAKDPASGAWLAPAPLDGDMAGTKAICPTCRQAACGACAQPLAACAATSAASLYCVHCVTTALSLVCTLGSSAPLAACLLTICIIAPTWPVTCRKPIGHHVNRYGRMVKKARRRMHACCLQRHQP